MQLTLKSAAFTIVNSPVLFFATSSSPALIWTVGEMIWRARSVPHAKVTPKDFGAALFHVFVVIPIVLFLYDRAFQVWPFPKAVTGLPLPVRVAIYLVGTDFGYCWMHRLMHTRHLWRFHKWHHSPTYAYWLAGCRATVQQQFLVGVP